MKELKCPQCGTMFTIDEADYASILSQVKTKEFESELQRRIKEMDARIAAEREAERAKSEQELERRVAEKMQQMSEKDKEITRLREQLSSAAKEKEMEMRDVIAERDRRIAELTSGLQQVETHIKLAVLEEQQRAAEQLQSKEAEIQGLRNEVQNGRNEAIIRENAIHQQYKADLRRAEEQIEFYRDLKSRMSTKMIGESLEQYCANKFEMELRPHMPKAQFGKDNKTADGTKGDFIFRNFDGDTEYISIMFEMKNEMEDTEKKHKNADFYKKLDDDRKKKGCEYAVLVTTLEADNDVFNVGIVDVSYLYEKMYVVRPQFFIPLITLLDNAAKKSIEFKNELMLIRSQSVDITNFEEKLTGFKLDIQTNVDKAHKNFEAAIKSIEKSIKDLEDVRDQLLKSGKNLRIANDKAMELTIRKLTFGNHTMQQMFKDEKARAEAERAAAENDEKRE